MACHASETTGLQYPASRTSGRERPVSTHDPEMTDTAASMGATHAVLVRQLSKSERFVRALALSAYVRNLAWQGALRHSGSRGESATVDRFLTQTVRRADRVGVSGHMWREP